MPYFISETHPDCDGWATVKQDGELMGCHDTKQEAIDQGVAIALAEGSEFLGERVAADAVEVGDFVSWNSSGGRAQGRIIRVVTDGRLDVPGSTFILNGTPEDPAALITVYRAVRDGWVPSDVTVGHRFSTLTAIGPLPEPSEEEDRELPDNYRPATSDDVPEGRACGNCVFYNEDRIDEDGVRVWCERWMDWVRGDHYCNAWQPDDDEMRQVDLTLPDYIRAAAAQGVEYHEQGLSGEGVVERTVREARRMADGQVTEDKVLRVSAWAARHAVDLDAEGALPGEDGYPTPGAVAHLLWGIPTGARYDDAVQFWDELADRVREEGRAMQKTPVEPRTKGSGVEFRSLEGEIRAEGDGNTFVGYAAVFNSDSEPLPFVERILPGAFAKTLRNRRRDVRLYVNHNSDMVLASKRSGTLRLSEDDRGLRVEADLPNTTAGNDLRELLRTGVVSKMSFGFTIPRGGDRWSEDGGTRELREITLHEVSVVTGFPAYEATAAAVRSLEHLAERTGMQVDELSEALDALAAGEELDPAKAETLMGALQASMPAREDDGEPSAADLLALQQKKLDLLAKMW
ncbi:MAG TPA: HK97 family phage prohead protease [Acidimicrobiia bacterium]